MEAARVDVVVIVRDTVAQPGCPAQVLGQPLVDDSMISEHFESGGGVIGYRPAGVRHPMSCKVNNVLDRKQKIKAGQVATRWIGYEVFAWSRDDGLDLFESIGSSRDLPSHDLRPHQAIP